MPSTKNKLKIGFVLDDTLDTEDGVQQYVRTLGSWLAAQGHSVHYLVGQTSRTDIAHVHSLARNIGVRFNGNRLSIPLPASGHAIKELLKAEQFDVLHVQVPYSPFFGAKVVHGAPKETVVVGTFHILPFGTLAAIGTRMLGWLLRHNLHRFDGHIAVSPAAQEFAQHTFGIHSKVIPNMVDTHKYIPSETQVPIEQEHPLELVFLGRLVARKGCLQLINALGVVHKRRPELAFHLTVCGKGPLMKQLEEKCHDHCIEDYVTFRGFVTEEEKIEALQSADIALFPAYGGESFGIVLIEAMASGSGVVVGGKNPGYESVLGSIPESLVEVNDPEVFAAYLLHLIGDTTERRMIHDKQQELVKQFATPVVGKQVEKLYQDCKKRRAAR